jgi:hypothetical protein
MNKISIEMVSEMRIIAIVFSSVKTMLSLSSVLEEDSQYRDILIPSGSLNSKITRLMYAKGEEEKKRRLRAPLGAR